MGAHVAWLVRSSASNLIFTLFIILSSAVISYGEGDADALLKFKQSLVHTGALNNWDPSKSPCNGTKANWNGVLCTNGYIWGLRLENMGLSGVIDLDALARLPYLRTFSFMNNDFSSPLPDMKKLGKLKSFFLSNNRFSGEIPDNTFAGMRSLKKVYLANNNFTSKIPSSLASLPKLLLMRLDGNHFEGQIPEFQQKGLRIVNLSNNNLEGPIPQNLQKQNASFFSGNKNLCGPPLERCEAARKTEAPADTKPLKAALILLAILLGLVLLVAVIIIGIYIVKRRMNRTEHLRLQSSLGNQSNSPSPKTRTPRAATTEHAKSTKKADSMKLSFVNKEKDTFDLQDLLTASAEVLGSGSCGASYKTLIMSGEALVVKRFKQMNKVGREEFHEHMRRIGRLNHPNLLPLVAYYYRRDEKLLISDFVDNGSLASHLHGNHNAEKPALDWPTRLKIVKGVARGLLYLHNELPTLAVPHGHLKSSNVLLDQSYEPLLMDYTLAPVINTEYIHHLLVAYKSPDFVKHRQLTRKADVWSLGVIILEILTGKFPTFYLTQGNANDAELKAWVNTIARENEVFDEEMRNTMNSQAEMRKLLKIGLACCEESVESRWEMEEVVEKIEEVNSR
ncbi:Leucine-rich repeat-containing N-terminal, plant-type [Dillenia turbinata]|uniref:non-specific serine/threonine protein kinase n=1 Tax=Dillenia turbinata TaxID=194707 RepID=A0AAN8UHB6_9MAGN